jgi:hypothetical protein
MLRMTGTVLMEGAGAFRVPLPRPVRARWPVPSDMGKSTGQVARPKLDLLEKVQQSLTLLARHWLIARLLELRTYQPLD